jgi:hypothetical protein
MNFYLKLATGIFILFTNISVTFAGTNVEACKETGFSINGKIFGEITEYHCIAGNDYLTKYTLNKRQELLRGQHSVSFVSDNSTKLSNYKDGNLFIFQDSSDPNLGCPARMFLIDLSSDKPRVYAFGVKNACAEYHWASWGKKHSVIAIKDNIRFTYSNGKLTPPPPDFGDGTPISRSISTDNKPVRMWPFVEELPVK